MAFNSLIFLLIFLPITIALYYLPLKSKSADNFKAILLLVLSLIFYSWGAIRFLPLLVTMIALNYFYIIMWLKNRFKNGKPGSNLLVTVLVVINVAVLSWGKYFAGAFPLALSFYIFKLLSAVFDIYNSLKETESKNLEEFKKEINLSPRNFSLYISFFPELISGPISRYKNFTPQIANAEANLDNLYLGFKRFIPALFIKVAIADSIFALRSSLLTNMFNFGAAEAWLSSILYTIYIFLDFASYSAMAISIGKMLGYEVPENFNTPYAAVSITDFWRRWHMTLSSWFRDYVYIPLGGNRKGLVRQLVNIGIVWALTGVWHGNQFNFLIWGLYYAVILIVEKLWLLKIYEKMPKFINWLITMFIVNLGWVLFAFPHTGVLFGNIGAMFGANGWTNGDAVYILTANVLLIILGVLASSSLLSKLRDEWLADNGEKSGVVVVFELVILLALIVLSFAFILDQSFASFLYFQF